jgi:ribosomal protein S18 acetylase RimI-like enzyme
VGLALLHEVFRRDGAAGLARTTLTVDGENESANRLYLRAGMRVTAEYRRWERDVVPPTCLASSAAAMQLSLLGVSAVTGGG